MSQSIITEQYLENIANSIRRKTDTDALIPVSDMAAMIDDIYEGPDVSDSTATEDDVIYGAIFHKSDKSSVEGKLLSTKHLNGQNRKTIYVNNKDNFHTLTALETLKVTKVGTTYTGDEIILYTPSNDNKRNNSFKLGFNATSGAFEYSYNVDIGDSLLTTKNFTINAYNAIFASTGLDILGYYIVGSHEILLIYSWLSSNTAAKIQRPGVYARLLSLYGPSTAVTIFGAVTLPYGTTAGSYYENINLFQIENSKDGLGDYIFSYNSFGFTAANVINNKRCWHYDMSLFSNNTSATFCNVGLLNGVSIGAKFSDGSDNYFLPTNGQMFTRISRTSAGVNTANYFTTSKYVKSAANGGILAPVNNTNANFVEQFTSNLTIPTGYSFGCGIIGELEDGNLLMYGALSSDSSNIQYLTKLYIVNIKYNRAANLSILAKLQEIDLETTVNSDIYCVLKCNILFNKSTGKAFQLILNSTLTGYELYDLGTFEINNNYIITEYNYGSVDTITRKYSTPSQQGQFSNIFEGIGENMNGIIIENDDGETVI